MAGEAPKRKRPLGLGQTAAKKGLLQPVAQDQETSKKAKVKESTAIDGRDLAKDIVKEQPVNAGEEDEEETLIELEIQAKEDEMEELESLYDAALLKLIESTGNNNNSDGAALLFRGVIHECDKLVRQVYDESASNGDSLARLKPTYYLVYGNALYRSGLLLGSDSDEMDAYLTAAMDQFELGLEKWSGDPKEKNLEALYLAAAFVLLHRASAQAEDTESSQTLAIKASDYIQKACSLVTEEKGKVEGALALQKYADSREDESGRMEWNGKAIEMLQEVVGNGTSIIAGDKCLQECSYLCLDDCKNVDAFTGLGNACLSQANYYADNAQGEDEASSDMPLSEELLKKALQFYEKGLDVDAGHAPTLISVRAY